MKYLRNSTFLTLILAMSFTLLNAETVTLKNTDGKEIKVTLIKATDKNLTFRFPGKAKTMTYPLDKLDAASNEIIKKWLQEGGGFSSNLSVEDYTTKKTNTRVNSGYYYDHERGTTITPRVTLKNKDINQTSGKGIIHVITLGAPIKYKSTVCLLNKQSIPFEGVKPNNKKEFSGESFAFAYDDDYGSYGAKYKGYVIIVKDAKGKTITSRASKDSLLEAGEKVLLTLEAGKVYDKFYKQLNNAYVRTNVR